MPPSAQGLIRPADLVGDAMRDASRQPTGFRSLREIVPRADSAPPETLLRSVAHAGDVDERLAQHPRPRKPPRETSSLRRGARRRGKALFAGAGLPRRFEFRDHTVPA